MESTLSRFLRQNQASLDTTEENPPTQQKQILPLTCLFKGNTNIWAVRPVRRETLSYQMCIYDWL